MTDKPKWVLKDDFGCVIKLSVFIDDWGHIVKETALPNVILDYDANTGDYGMTEFGEFTETQYKFVFNWAKKKQG